MASGTIWLSTDGVLTGKIDWSSTSNGSVANTSTLTATMYARRTDSYTTYGSGWGGYLYVDGITTDVYFTETQYVSSDWHWMASMQKTIQHGSDGKGYAYIEGAVRGASGTSLANRYVSGSQTVQLDTIPRASTISSITTSNVEKLLTVKINYDKKYSGFTHDICYIYNNKTYTPTTKSDNNGYCSFSVNYENLVDTFPTDSASITITVRLLTYSGTQQIGYSDKTCTITLPESIYAPTITNLSVVDTDEAIISKFGKLIQSKSSLLITPTSKFEFNATLKGYTYLVVNNEVKNTSDPSYETKAIEQITDGKVKVEVKVVDSRGLQSETYEVEKNALLYGNPVISSFSAERDEETPSTINVFVNCNLYSLETHNDKRAVIKYQRQDTQATLSKDITELFELVDDKYVIDETVSLLNCDEDTKYNITLEVYDYFNTSPISTTPFIVPTEFSLINYNIAGDGLAFGKIADNNLDHTIEIADNMTMLYHGEEIGTGGGGDTLPFGAIVDYDGDSVPSGYEEVQDVRGQFVELNCARHFQTSSSWVAMPITNFSVRESYGDTLYFSNNKIYARKSCKVYVYGQISYNSANTGDGSLEIRKANTVLSESYNTGGYGWERATVSAITQLNAGEYLQLTIVVGGAVSFEMLGSSTKMGAYVIAP